MAEDKKTIKEMISAMVSGSLAKLKLEAKFSIDYPQEAVHGDYATNAALIASKKIGRSAPEVAYEIIENFSVDRVIFDRVEVSSRGFINFFLSKEFVLRQVPLVVKPSYGQTSVGDKTKVNMEFISANPTGPLHLGHARGAFYGDALSNVLKYAGYILTREYYVNDAKASNQIKELGKTVLGLGTSYAGPYLDKKIKEFKDQGFSFMGLGEAEAGRLVAQAIQEDNRYFIEEKLNIKLNKWFSEEGLYEEGLTDSVFSSLEKRGLLYQKDDAVWLKSTEFGDVRDRVLIRSSAKGGAATYYYTDMPYYLNKVERGFEIAIYILGADHHDDAKFLSILPKLFGKSAEVQVILTQLVTFKQDNLAVKLSKRRGQVINLEWLLDEVGVDAARFFYLLKSPNTHMEFDVDLAKAKNLQNPVFYIQYTHARLASILRKAKESKLSPDIKKISLLGTEEELNLIKNLMRFPEMIMEVAQSRQVHALPHYLLNLAVMINSFYEKERIIQEKNRDLTAARLTLIQAAKSVIGKVLGLLGMSAPIKM